MVYFVRKSAAVLLSLFLLFAALPSGEADASENDKVFVIPVEQTVESGLKAFLERAVEDAESAGADHIIFEIDTPGGAVDAAGDIASLIEDASVPTTAYVVEEAMSAGAYLALSADEIAMAPDTQMGAAQVITGSGNAAGTKVQSSWEKNMQNAAALNGRNPEFALAMADPSVDLPEYSAGKGELLTLTASEAAEVNYAEYTPENREALLQELNLSNAEVQEIEVSAAEKIARFVTNPVLIPILLSVGSIGLIIELYSPGFGIPGILGASSLGLFFFGHMIAGFAGYEALILAGAGLILLAVELFIPGFGIFGLLGAGAFIASLFFASYSTLNIAVSILIALILSVVTVIMMFSVFKKRGPVKRFVLEDSVTTDEGFISNENRPELIGQTGKSLTPLRPSGSMQMGDERLDVVSEGGYIEKGRDVKIVKAEGSRIVVRDINE
ncbi:NfeD family protein [Salibacterium halotolerans]|uniref:Membrane-bound serine protease (ClpP class) n=1 Tax=Salibacterium halotolerans TaxID=1884432 RepID=A0A1I5NG59_9BACI|nr:nodulation protein NfeD [Salibacterium halotolerans]SFP20680.1 membrane-bound serine protease (ClpP class) [Salibacterium halotolerans]